MKPVPGVSGLRGEVAALLLLALAAFVLLPWYAQEDGFFSFVWLTDGWIDDSDYAPGLFQALRHGRWWLWPLPFLLLPALAALSRRRPRKEAGRWLMAAGALTLAWLLFQGFAINHRGWAWSWLT
ncbi:MAG TPA: iron ABC transporter permease, partial [Rhodospirillales bacterium]|nr:iron ABC transporter permease [Rhodospirillales bacterium]